MEIRESQQTNTWAVVGLVLLFLAMWIGGFIIERVDFAARPPMIWFTELEFSSELWSTPGGSALSFLMPRVWRHIIPFFIGWWLARRATLNLIVDLFDLDDRGVAVRFLNRTRNRFPTPDTVKKLNRKTFHKDRHQSILLKFGGPGFVQINHGDVAITEKNGAFSRTLGAGLHALEPFEYVRSVLDLRPQERTRRNVRVMTRDGIELSTDLVVHFQISRGESTPTQANPFPFDAGAVWLAGYDETVLLDDHIERWEEVPMRLTIESLINFVGGRPLSRLLFPENDELKPHELIKKRLIGDTRIALRQRGIDLIDIRLGRLTVPDEVTRHLIDSWQQRWEKRRTGNRAAIEAASFQTQVKLLHQLTEMVSLDREMGHLESNGQVIDVVERMQQLTQSNANLPSLESQLMAIKEKIRNDENR